MRGLMFGCTVVLAAAAVATAQDTPDTATPIQPVAPAGAGASVGVVDSQGFGYDPEGRRDPFVNLLRRGPDGLEASSARPSGLAGLGAAEVTLKGTVRSRDGYVAMLQGVDARTYVVRPGDRLYDGTIRAITETALVILQQVTDPLSLEKEREVRKTIRQTDEAQ